MAIRKINYHGTSKILLRLCETVNSLIESGGGGGSKHTIINKNGTAMSDRAGLQFTGGATVTDDSVNDKTVVQIPDEQIQSDWNQTTTTAKDYIKNKPTSLPANGGTSDNVFLYRVAESCNNLPSGGISRIREYSAGANYDLPTNNYYHILESGSPDTNWGTQLALGMTDGGAVYYRRYANGSWQSWSRLAFEEDLPTVNNATLTIQKNGTTVKTFTANASSNVTCNITVPTSPSGVGINNVLYSDTDIPEGAANLSTTATAHKITAYRNGFSIPYKANDTNDGGILRVRGTTESDCILELGTWDDSGAGETIQFNYYPTTSQVTPTYSVSVPKKSGTIALTSDIPTDNNQLANGAGYITSSGSCASATKATKDGNGSTISSTYLKKSGGNMSGNLGIGSSAGGGYLNGSASNGGCNSILIGDDVWLGDVNLSGIMGMKSTGANCGFRFLNSSGTNIGTLQSTAGTLQFNGNTILNSNNCTGYASHHTTNEDCCYWGSERRLKVTQGSGNYSYNDSGFGVKNAADSGFATIYASNVGSSLKFKENVQTMTDEEAEKLLKIRVVTYDYKRGIGIADGADAYNQRGVIAEEVNKIIPYAVIKRELGSDGSVLEPYGVEYHKFIPYLIKMIQIQQEEINELKAQIKEIMEVIK